MKILVCGVEGLGERALGRAAAPGAGHPCVRDAPEAEMEQKRPWPVLGLALPWLLGLVLPGLFESSG